MAQGIALSHLHGKTHYGKQPAIVVVAAHPTALQLERVLDQTLHRLDDVELSERKGTLTIRSDKGNKWREVPLNADLRRALKRYLAERPDV
jgi:site-specific recombinase XerC